MARDIAGEIDHWLSNRSEDEDDQLADTLTELAARGGSVGLELMIEFADDDGGRGGAAKFLLDNPHLWHAAYARGAHATHYDTIWVAPESEYTLELAVGLMNCGPDEAGLADIAGRKWLYVWFD